MKLIACEFNMDSGCVELRFDDGTTLGIDCTAVEHKYGHTIQKRAELDWMIYNAPLEYAQLVLTGEVTQYLEMNSTRGTLEP